MALLEYPTDYAIHSLHETTRNQMLVQVVAGTLALSSVAEGAQASIWPPPQSVSLGRYESYLDQTFTVRCATATCPRPLPAAFRRYRELALVAGLPRACTVHEPSITSLDVFVADAVPLSLEASEVRDRR